MNHPLNIGGVDLPRDFSVYYIAAWRMFHNPSQIFTTGHITDGEPTIYPSLTPYKYLPSFLVLISPLITLSYYPAFWVFDAFQFALLPLMAFLLYELLEKKNPAIAFLILVLVLLLPYPMPGRGLSVSYFMSWAEGQAKIFLSFLLLVSFYFGYKGRAALSGVAFALGAFDPRFALLALPLFLFYNKAKLKAAFVPMIITLIGTNFMVFYPGTAQGFLDMILGSGSTTPLYTPAWIPLVMLVSLILVNSRQMIKALKPHRESNN
ncbi:MAG: glycosyltransferase 87 family protein [Candidatus Paceibacterales bacterium]